MSQKMVEFLGYNMQEFREIFLAEGYPAIYPNITSIQLIKQMYMRDNSINKCLQNRTISQPYSKRGVLVNFTIKGRKVDLNLLPGDTIIFPVNQSAFLCLRTYTLDPGEVERARMKIKGRVDFGCDMGS